MEVILLKDVKGKGKKEDVIKVSIGYGNFLVKSGAAKPATTGNMNELHNIQEQRAEDEKNHVAEMQKLKTELESKNLKLSLKAGVDGKLFGSINSKQIADQIKIQYSITVDKKKVSLTDAIKSTGNYKVKIKLHKEVIAEITVEVEGK